MPWSKTGHKLVYTATSARLCFLGPQVGGPSNALQCLVRVLTGKVEGQACPGEQHVCVDQFAHALSKPAHATVIHGKSVALCASASTGAQVTPVCFARVPTGKVEVLRCPHGMPVINLRMPGARHTINNYSNTRQHLALCASVHMAGP
jgi:hypothetical protein